MRLERLLANRGYCARSQVAGFMRKHDLTLNGQRITRADHDIATPEQLRIDGEPIDAQTLLLALHKPTGLVCSHNPHEGPSVFDLLPQRWQQRRPAIQSVGRLDKDTSGLLLLTDDGALLHRLTSPRHHVEKVYIATLESPLRGDEAERFASGSQMLDSEDKPLLPATMRAIDAHTAELTLVEGRYHQVRRMFAAVGHHVVTLHRQSVGPVSLASLALDEPGRWCLLQAESLPWN
jgi:16S rRNA pseudouridine516 synthase